MKTPTAVRECPIHFTDESVRAILAGTKTQTRRVIKPQPTIPPHKIPSIDAFRMLQLSSIDDLDGRGEFQPHFDLLGIDPGKVRIYHVPNIRCPFGVPGDRLWVKETWAYPPESPGPVYRATASKSWEEDVTWKSPLFMPRIYSRIILELTDVRVQRVQEISAEDAKAEGIKEIIINVGKYSNPTPSYVAFPDRDGGLHSARAAYEFLWDSLNAKRGYGWNENPWVWAITFKRSEPKP